MKGLLKKYPKLKNRLPLRCKCGKILKFSHIEISRDFIGVVSYPCSCNLYEQSGVFITKNKEGSQKWLKLLQNFYS